MRLNRHRNAVLALAALTGLTITGRKADAQISQLHPSFYGSAEADTHHGQFYLLGMYVGMGGLGWSPYLNVNAYNLHYRVLQSQQSLTAVLPTLGMAYAARRSGFSFGAGYAWVNNDDAGAPGAEGGGADGVTASFGAYHNGTGRRPLHTQLLSSYNFGSQYVWVRGRASQPFRTSKLHPARIGAEIVGQGGGKNGLTSSVFEVGPTLEYQWTPNFRTTGVVGYKSIGGYSVTSRTSAAYFKLEFSYSP